MEPDWSCLPGSPERFFGLEPGYDRAELKRRYNSLLHRYKPERFPEEFKKLRAAYEALERKLKSPTGAPSKPPISVPPPAPPAPAAATHAASSAAAREEPSATESTSFHATIKERYVRLRDLRVRSAGEFVQLALLADAFEPAEELAFERWLLEGLRVHPNDPALLRLFHDEAQHVRVDHIGRMLTEAQAKLDAPVFLRATSPLWTRLLAERGFAEFASRLGECEARLPVDLAIRPSFEIYVLRFAAWHADESWRRARLANIESHHRRLDPGDANELDFLALLVEYLATRDAFLDGNPLRAAVDATLRTYCTDRPVLALQALTGCLAAMRRDLRGMLRALPATCPEAQRALEVFAWVERDLAARAYGPDARGQPDLRGSLRDLKLRIRRKQRNSRERVLMSFVTLFYYLTIAAVVLAPTILIVSYGSADSSKTAPVAIGVLFAWAALFFWRVNRWTLRALQFRILRVFLRRNYERVARPEVARFLAHVNLGVSELCSGLNAIAEPPSAPLLANFVAKDVGLGFFVCTRNFIG